MQTKAETLETIMSLMCERIGRAHAVAMTADACAKVGNLPQAFRILLGVEPHIYDINHMLSTASVLSRELNTAAGDIVFESD